MIVIQEVVIVVTSANGYRRQVLTDSKPLLKCGRLNLFLQQLIFGQAVDR